MEELLFADSIRCFSQKNWETPFSLRGYPGERIFIHGTRGQCQFLFEILSGLRRPDTGVIAVLGRNLYDMPEPERAAFRREQIGAVPPGGGFIPELPLLEQLLWPLTLSGMGIAELRQRIQEIGINYLPTYNLYNPTKRCTPRITSLTALLRASLFHPKIILMNSTFDYLNAKDTEIIWQEAPKIWDDTAVFLYLSSTPIPQEISWTRQLRI